MSIYNGQVTYGVPENPLTDSPYIQQLDVGLPPAPPSGNNFLLLDNTDFLLLDGGNFELL